MEKTTVATPTPTVVKGDLLTEKGNLKVAVSNKFKESFTQKLMENMEYTVANNNTLLVEIARDEKTDTPIYANVTVSITKKNSFYVKGAKKKAENDVVIPDLF